MKFIYIILFTLFTTTLSAQIELFQLEWALDSTYVIGADTSGEPIWILKSSLPGGGPDSTNIIGGWGIEATESPANTWNLIVDSSQVATQYDLTLKENALSFTSPLVRSFNNISIPAASTSVSGYLTSTDWNIFNNFTKMASANSDWNTEYYENRLKPLFGNGNSPNGLFGYGFWSGHQSNVGYGAQLAITGNASNNPSLYFRTRDSGTFQSWARAVTITGSTQYYIPRVDANGNLELATTFENNLYWQTGRNMHIDKSQPYFKFFRSGSDHMMMGDEVAIWGTNAGSFSMFLYGNNGFNIATNSAKRFQISGAGIINMSSLDTDNTAPTTTGTTKMVITDASGNLSFATAATGTVSSVGITGSDFTITGSPVTTSGNIGLEIATGVVGATELASTAVTPGSYTNTNLTVDADGRITAAASGTSGVTTLAAIGAVPNANGASISGSTLTLQPASASFGGVVTASASNQSFTGPKTFLYLGGAPVGGNSLVVADQNGRLENLFGATVGHVPKWNGTAFTLQADATGASGITSLGGLTGATQTLAYETSGTTPSWLSTGTSHTFRLPTGVAGEVLKWSSGDWRPGFPISLTTTGTSGNATYNNTTGVLNIPNYAGSTTYEQYWLTDADATSHQIRLAADAAAPAPTVSLLRMVEGTGINLTSANYTFNGNNYTNGQVTISQNNTYQHVINTSSDNFNSSSGERLVQLNTSDGSAGFSVSPSTDLITIASAGTYLVTYDIVYKHVAASLGKTYLKVNGTVVSKTNKRFEGTTYNNISKSCTITTTGSNQTLGLYTWVTTGSNGDQIDDVSITILRLN